MGHVKTGIGRAGWAFDVANRTVCGLAMESIKSSQTILMCSHFELFS